MDLQTDTMSFLSSSYRYFQPTITYWRRYAQFRWSMFHLKLSTSDARPFPPLTLLDNHEIEHRSGEPLEWKLTDDRVLGGYTESQAIRIADPKSWAEHVATNSSQQEEGAHGPTRGDQSDDRYYPYLHWSGTTDTTVGLESRVQRSGFSHILSPPVPVSLDTHYQALEITARGSPGRIFSVQLHLAGSMQPDRDTYQGQLVFSPTTAAGAGPFETFLLPISAFSAVGKGRQRENTRRLDQKDCVREYWNHVGR